MDNAEGTTKTTPGSGSSSVNAGATTASASVPKQRGGASQRPRPGQQQQSQQQRARNQTAADSPPVSAEERAEREKQAELRYYTKQIYMIIKPVIVCILLSVLWVKLSTGAFGVASDYRPQRSSFATYSAADPSDSGQQMSAGLINALIILSQIILATIIFVVLFKFGCWKILYGYLFLTVVLLLGFMSFLLLLSIVQVLSIPMDYVTLAFILYNFSVTGIMTIFWRGPLWLQQAYLVVMSSLMAFALTGLDEWTTWILLAVLAIWDLVAVLCPFGPLKILVESAREQNRDIPALLYSVNMVYFMAHDTSPPVIQKEDEGKSASGSSRTAGAEASAPAASGTTKKKPTERLGPATATDNNSPARQNNNNSSASAGNRPNATQTEGNEDDDDESGGLKLGLGDFVFYSVLIARTALYDWVTTMSCVIAVLMGLNLTILLLAIYRKALPALPISIAFGLVFYFVSAKTLVPMCNWMAVNGVLV